MNITYEAINMDNNKDLKTAIEKELEMCAKYPYYKCTLYYQNDIEHQKIKTIESIIKQIVQERYGCIVYHLRLNARIYYNVDFRNHSRFYATPIYEGTRGLQNHHSLVDVEISQDISRNIIHHSLIGANMYDDVFGDRGRMIEDQDKNHFGKVTDVNINIST